MQTWLEVDEFCKLVHIDKDVVEDMIERGKLHTREEGDKLYVEASQGTFDIVPSSSQIVPSMDEIRPLPGVDFAEKTIGTILNLHEKVLDAKDETLDALRSENRFLKEALFSLQELYDEDRKTIETLTTQLKMSQEEVEFLKRNYKLIRNKAVKK